MESCVWVYLPSSRCLSFPIHPCPKPALGLTDRQTLCSASVAVSFFPPPRGTRLKLVLNGSSPGLEQPGLFLLLFWLSTQPPRAVRISRGWERAGLGWICVLGVITVTPPLLPASLLSLWLLLIGAGCLCKERCVWV